ncbi:ThuA domain-containing protein [Novosphingobium sp.]|uniref:ThuA domain-containing protein n=1 Tax=Novosphingobium sp. TaxID=1874826 RepID=UPI00286DBF77|nr:ThuA domain-containing protein [Novosphingobium sp.]
MHLIAAGRFHDIDYARLQLLQLLAETAHVRTTTASGFDDLASLSSADLLITYTCDIVPNEAETEAMRAFLERGGRWLALHGSNAVLEFLGDGRIGAKPGADSYMDLIGSRFLAHPPIGAFTVEVTEPDHPLTRGIAPFEVIDELYLFEHRSEFQTLLHTRFTGSCAPFAHADWDTDTAPVMYHRAVGTGGIVYLSLGHCRGHYDPSPDGAFFIHPTLGAWAYPVFRELLRRSITWGIADKMD